MAVKLLLLAAAVLTVNAVSPASEDEKAGIFALAAEWDAGVRDPVSVPKLQAMPKVHVVHAAIPQEKGSVVRTTVRALRATPGATVLAAHKSEALKSAAVVEAADAAHKSEAQKSAAVAEAAESERSSAAARKALEEASARSEKREAEAKVAEAATKAAEALENSQRAELEAAEAARVKAAHATAAKENMRAAEAAKEAAQAEADAEKADEEARRSTAVLEAAHAESELAEKAAAEESKVENQKTEEAQAEGQKTKAEAVKQQTELEKASERRLQAEAREKSLTEAVAEAESKRKAADTAAAREDWLAAEKERAEAAEKALEAATLEAEEKAKAEATAAAVVEDAEAATQKSKATSAVVVQDVEEKKMTEVVAQAEADKTAAAVAVEDDEKKKMAEAVAQAEAETEKTRQEVDTEETKLKEADVEVSKVVADEKEMEDGAVSDSTKSMEAAMMNMMIMGSGGVGVGSGVGGATPLGESTKTISKLIVKGMMPKVLHAHEENQKELNRLSKDLAGCGKSRNGGMAGAKKMKVRYLKFSPLHKSCRSSEAALSSELSACQKEIKDKTTVAALHCKRFKSISRRFGNQQANKQIVTKGGSESVESYITRITATVCGQGGEPAGVKGKLGMLDEFKKSKKTCDDATKTLKIKNKVCNDLKKNYRNKKQECDQLQDKMDNAACRRAVLVKDACESYAECFASKQRAFKSVEKMVRKEEKDRKSEWKALNRMKCLIDSFGDGKVEQSEVTACKEKSHDTSKLNIKYPVLLKHEDCEVPHLYPATAAYKKAEFAPLPALAKGKTDANECYGVAEISTDPKKGSPSSCKCERVTMNGPYSPGPVVKCVNCWDVRRTTDKNSCPYGTKLFSPRSRNDWRSFLSSAGPLRAPHWIIDVTRPQNGCGGCTKNEMNSDNAAQKKSGWRTADGSPWWLRSRKYSEPNGDYHSNCFMDLWHTPKDENSITWNDHNCNYHAKSYYCQATAVNTRPKDGSPTGCVCAKVELTGKYSPGGLVKCVGCIDVRRTTQKNSCPTGTKIFAPATRNDWKTFLSSASPLRSPHWIVDVTRPQNGCGGCTKSPMNSNSASQATWKTADGASWWLRSTKYSEPNGDYTANCYMDLWRTPTNEQSVTFNDGRCNYHSTSYYCQDAKPRK